MTLRPGTMRLACMFSSILLFGAAGLLLFISLQDPTELAPQQVPGVKFNIRPQQPHKDLQPGSSHDGDMKVSTERVTQDLSSRAPRDLKLRVPDQPQFHPKTGSRLRLRQRRRRLLIKKMPAAVAVVANSSSENLVRPGPQTLDSHWVSLHRSQQERKRVMREACAKYRASSSRRPVTPRHVSRIFVEDRHRVLYCEVPKAGCSNWKRVLMVLAGLASSTADIQHNTVHYGSALKRLDTFDRQGILHRLGTYTKMLFVREPFERLVSAFRDKFEHPNSYYHPVFGKAILARYRANASREALRTGSGVRFPEFIQYLLDVHRPVGMDIHWDHVSRLCSPCLIDYDFVGKFESMEDDANFFLSLIRAPHNLTFPRFKDRHSQEARTTSRITHQYFAQLSALQRQRTYDFYYMDYLMFNYSKPFADLY
ncbi:PREDICTED: carbohydrate sulfotransferase 8 [Chinchilla lanigera]|uniref:Carbohydrate sulfotransferase n=1 Tax=Chinchilla lanigera TaxID=34839 RepID=A0A8C2YSV3_CHILA|nr:PREDICTED: carbohydrate sulfotransferase 8 [Chinchilla lanigera]XP_005400047.1 PREDICTED: carbohydrate sulfotransferase 8 [Chinchilla lanigera]XP_005400048.1 PREDICTED: carbohydrate sulfotransferase 8 [Chinchilla lanigera]XP_005400049.1 PREDICTED: carbohydrate sulfotransferase 8 [Chinchilla lanigera]